MDKTQISDGRLSVRQSTIHFCLGAVIVCVVNMIAAGLASFWWAGPLQAVGYAALSVRVSSCVLLLGWIVLIVIKPARHKRVITRILVAVCVLTTIVTYQQSKEPSAAQVFESELGFQPDADFTNLRSFISRARIRVPTTGLQFRVNETSLARLIRTLHLGRSPVEVAALSSIRENANSRNPAPSWFAEGTAEVRMKHWERTDDNGDLEIDLDEENMVVYVVRQAR